MKINNIQNNSSNTSFGTYLGANIQEKVLLLKTKNAFSQSQNNNLLKIENDELPAVLDIIDKISIKKINQKACAFLKKRLALIVNGDKIIIDDLENVYKPCNSHTQFSFSFVQFAKLFSNEYNLAEKIKDAYTKLTENKHID